MVYFLKFFTRNIRGLLMSLTKLLAFNTNEKKILLCVMLTAMMMLTTGFTNSSIPCTIVMLTFNFNLFSFNILSYFSNFLLFGR